MSVVRWRSVPVCADCWYDYEEKIPVHLKDADKETCMLCGSETISGIFIRAKVEVPQWD